MLTAVAAVATLSLIGQQAWSFSLSCPWGKCPPKKKEIFDDSRKTLIFQLASNPTLMNVEYLKYLIGPPEDERRRTGPERHYFWYDQGRQMKYELDQSSSAPGQITQSIMVINLAGTGLTFDKLEKELQAASQDMPMYGQGSPVQAQDYAAASQPMATTGGAYNLQPKKFFDYNGRANELFSFAPNTYLSFDCPPNSFRLNEARIVYRGAPLPAPSQEQLQMAAMAYSEKAAAAGLAEEDAYNKTKPGKKRKPSKDKNAVPTAELVPMLITSVRNQPLDPGAHLMLAQALKREAHLNEAISEYKIALAMSGDNQQVRDQALAGLQEMMIVPDYVPPDERQYKILDNGRMRVIDPNQKPTKDKDAADN